MTMLKRIRAGVLRVAYFENGSSNGTPVILLHGFPYDVHAYDADIGINTISTLREGEQV
jgi:pimeloyl-ACP methyl ester carboxylesterase